MTTIPTEQIETAFDQLFGGSLSATGEEELLRIASKYSVQLSARQMRTLLLIQSLVQNNPDTAVGKSLKALVEHWLEYKQYHGSMPYIMRTLDSIALRKFIKEDSIRASLNKGA